MNRWVSIRLSSLFTSQDEISNKNHSITIIDKNCFNKLWRFNENDFKWIFNQFDKQTKTSSNRYYYVEKHDQIKYFCFKCLDEFCWDAQQKYNQNTHTAHTYIHTYMTERKSKK